MKSPKGLTAAILGLAMLAVPVTASAKEHRHGVLVSRYVATSTAPAHWNYHHNRDYWSNRNYAPGYVPQVAPYAVTAVPYVPPVSSYAVAPTYPSYGYNSYAPITNAPVYGFNNHPNACVNAQRLAEIARTDRLRGHPAAANDVLRQSQRANANCYANGGGGVNSLLGYNGYNGGYSSPLAGLLGGVPVNRYGNSYGNGYGYGNSYGYNTPYNTYPNNYGGAAMLAPLLQNFIH